MINQRICDLLRAQSLPAVVVDLDAFDRNLAKMAMIAKNSGKKLRIATKSLRVPDLISRALSYGPPVEGLMCYAAEEAVLLSRQFGFDNLLVAYPTLQEANLLELKKIHALGKTVSLVFDQEQSLKTVSKIMGPLGPSERPFPVLIELDVSTRLFFGALHLGVRRSPIRDSNKLLDLIQKLALMPNLQFTGIMAYEAQVAGLGDKNPFKPLINLIARLVRKYSVRSVSKIRDEISRLLVDRNIGIQIFNGGGTGSLSYAAQEEVLTELTVGSGLLCPHLFDYYSNLDLEPACYFALESVRNSDPNFVTCQGGGYIASGEIGLDRLPLPVYPAGLSLTGTEGCGEVQTPLRIRSGEEIPLGSPILFRHAKAGELAERFNEYLLYSNGKIVGSSKTYRGLGWSFF